MKEAQSNNVKSKFIFVNILNIEFKDTQSEQQFTFESLHCNLQLKKLKVFVTCEFCICVSSCEKLRVGEC